MRVIEVGPHLDEPPGAVAEAHALSGFGAVHLASALLVGSGDMVIATWDARLHTAVSAIGYATLPTAL